jgi:Asp-tRNA(Asn)/Glu-tRNA(Gln) amidotransferase C subunit
MNAPARSLKNDKVTFAVVIGILLCSLIYTSGYTLVVKEENEKFKQELRAIEQEMNVLFEVLPTPDEESVQKKQMILRQVEKIRKDFYHNNISPTSKQELFSQLSGVKTQVGDLEERIKTAIVQNQEISAAAEGSAPDAFGDSAYYVSNTGSPHFKNAAQILPTAPVNLSSEKKVAVYYFRAYSSDKKNRYHRTKSITLELQLQGHIELLNDPFLRIEIRDPENHIITTGKERIRAATEYMASYIFEPDADTKFKKGRYVIRIYSKNNEFQQLTFLFLV